LEFGPGPKLRPRTELTVSTFVSSFRHERIATVGKIYTRMQMRDLIDDFDLINYKTTHDNHGVHGWPHSPR
jgi:hypothetical protein